MMKQILDVINEGKSERDARFVLSLEFDGCVNDTKTGAVYDFRSFLLLHVVAEKWPWERDKGVIQYHSCTKLMKQSINFGPQLTLVEYHLQQAVILKKCEEVMRYYIENGMATWDKREEKYVSRYIEYTKEELKKYWAAKCPDCLWRGLSRDAAGGGHNGVDHDDVLCPKCGAVVDDDENAGEEEK